MANGANTAAMDAATNGLSPNPILVLEPVNNTFAIKSLELAENTRIKIGRQTSVATAPNPTNGYFDSKVLSRVHAEVWSEGGKVFIRDLKSSNGTFLNGRRLCPENVESEPFALNQNDQLEFGIDIMDENGALLHEKVACKIYISRMPYPSPGGSPKEAHAKPRSSSPTGSSKSTTGGGATGGQSTNIDLIISRLQSELTRSQETNADLGALKQGLGELERAITASSKENSKSSSAKRAESSAQSDSATDYQKLLEEHIETHTLEVAKLNKQLEETQAEVEAYLQKIQLLEPLVAEDEILRRDIAQSGAELTKIKLERDLAKDSMNELITEHQQAMDSLRKEHEAAMAAMEAMHKETLLRVQRESTMAQEALSRKHETLLEEAKTPDTQALEALRLEVPSLKADVTSLEQTVEKHTKEIQELSAGKADLIQQLSDANAELVRKDKELLLAKQRIEREELAALTPTSSSNIAVSSICKQCSGPLTTTTLASSTTVTKDFKNVVTKHESSWSGHQSSTMAMSGGVMLVGIGAFILWNKIGLSR
ncbi:hypothetical protein BGX34_000949 [Mortierella sp. NVP85]|nr:hypothetical protein BGX34_000949 [Mortierella sp. NVP85]